MTINGFVAVLLLAIVVEGLVEYAKSVILMFTKRDYKRGVIQLTALVCSVLLCLSADADLFSLAGLSFGQPFVGKLLTGIFASRGANYVNDLADRLRGVVKTQ